MMENEVRPDSRISRIVAVGKFLATLCIFPFYIFEFCYVPDGENGNDDEPDAYLWELGSRLSSWLLFVR